VTPGNFEPETEHQLAADFQRGDPDALSLTIEQFSNEIFRYLYLCTRREDLAEDLTQEVFLRAYAKRHLLVRFNHFRAWLFTIARNIAAKEMKRHHYRLEMHMEDLPPGTSQGLSDGNPGASALSQQSQMRDLLIEAVNALDGEDRELILLRYFSELPLKEISEALGIPMGSIGGKLNRALQTIRTHFEGQGLSWDDLGPME